jgi:hypothetical protein
VLLLVVVVGGGAFWYTTMRGSGGTTGLNTTPALFSDNFDGNTNKWTLTSTSGYTRSIDGGYLKIRENNQSKVLYNDFPNQPPTDATISVNFTLVKAGKDDITGLILRNKSVNNSIFGYYIDVYGDGSYDIQRYYLDTSTNKGKVDYLLREQSTALKGIGQENAMTVTIKGSSISLTLNGQFITTVTDSTNTFVSGPTSLFVETSDDSDGVEAWFNSVAVYAAK